MGLKCEWINKPKFSPCIVFYDYEISREICASVLTHRIPFAIATVLFVLKRLNYRIVSKCLSVQGTKYVNRVDSGSQGSCNTFLTETIGPVREIRGLWTRMTM